MATRGNVKLTTRYTTAWRLGSESVAGVPGLSLSTKINVVKTALPSEFSKSPIEGIDPDFFTFRTSTAGAGGADHSAGTSADMIG